MRAVVVNAPGAAPSMTDVPIPKPGKDEILVRVVAAGVNPVDWKSTERDGRSFPMVLGQDFSGVVVASESSSRRFEPDQRVFGIARDHGSYAEFTVVPDNDDSQPIAPMPNDLSYVDGAALPTAGLTALASLDQLGVERNTTLLIVGLSGGVGMFAAQIALRRSVQVIGIAHSRNRELLESLGGVKIVYYDREDPVEAVRAHAPQGIEAILDLVDDKEHVERMIGLLKDGGSIVSTIGALDDTKTGDRGIKATNIVMDRTHESSPQGLHELASLVGTGLLRVFVAEHPSMETVDTVLEKSRQGSSAGKTVIMIGPQSHHK